MTPISTEKKDCPKVKTRKLVQIYLENYQQDYNYELLTIFLHFFFFKVNVSLLDPERKMNADPDPQASVGVTRGNIMFQIKCKI